jgi:hypothetical protein
MKVYVMYNDSGAIGGTFAPPIGRNIRVRPSDGLSVHLHEAPSVSAKERRAYLSDLHNNHWVDMSSGEPKLIRRAGSKK